MKYNVKILRDDNKESIGTFNPKYCDTCSLSRRYLISENSSYSFYIYDFNLKMARHVTKDLKLTQSYKSIFKVNEILY